jgi:hypothetical protein
MSYLLVDPLCISRGYDQLSHYSIDPHCTLGGYTSIFVNTVMDPQCILWRPYLINLGLPSIGMPALGFEIMS